MQAQSYLRHWAAGSRTCKSPSSVWPVRYQSQWLSVPGWPTVPAAATALPPPITLSPQGLPDMRSQQLPSPPAASPAQDCSGLDMTPCPVFASYVLATMVLRCSVHLISPCLGWQVHREQHQMVTGPGSCWGGARPSLTPGLEAASACQLR